MKRLQQFVWISVATWTISQVGATANATLVSYWPLNALSGTTTPDVVGGFDMNATNIDGANVVPGVIGNAFSFDNAAQTLLSRVHSPGEDLPINQHPSFTVSMWANVTGAGQNDLRLFSEGTTASATPLYNLGTQQGGLDGRLDLFVRPGAGHEFSTAEPFDGSWHHIAMVTDQGAYTLYVDGVQDATNFVGGVLADLDTTSIGGIERAAMQQSHWVTGLIDDVSLWKSALSEPMIEQLAAGVSPTELSGDELPPGDVNGDMVADLADFAIIRDNFQKRDVLRSDGDLDLDRVVGLKDFKIWKDAAFPAAGGPASVPEPATVGLLAGGLLLLVGSVRRRRVH